MILLITAPRLVLSPVAGIAYAAQRPSALSHPFADAAQGEDKRLQPARLALERQEFVSALRLCQEARKQGAPLADALRVQSDVFKATGYLDKEMETLQHWSDLASRAVEPLLKLFYIDYDLGWMRQADSISRRLVQIAPQNSRCHLTRALILYKEANPTPGLPFIEKARRLQPNNLDLVNLHVLMLLKAHQYARAEAVAREAVTRDPSLTKNRLALASALLSQQKTPEAIAIYQDILRREPQNIEAIYQLGVQRQKQGNDAEALRLFQQVARQDVGYGKTGWYLGNLQRKQGNRAAADALLKRYQAMNTDADAFNTALSRLPTHDADSNLHAQLARMHADMDELPQAIVEWRRALQLRPGDAQAKSGLAEALRRHGRIGEAQQLQRG